MITISKTHLLNTKIRDITMYGFRLTLTNGEIFAYPAVSASEENAKRLLDSFTENGISYVHFNDVVRDYILGNAYELIEANGIPAC